MKVTKDKPAFCNTNEINIVDKHDYTMKDIDSVGGKGYNLLRLKSEGFNVPDFFILPTEHLFCIVLLTLYVPSGFIT